ncbi:hypothetical protein [Ramlibacter sp. AN1133]|uniref:hypothetical protein n=1 Tax=Ramlibacter sp. AN1133 TaxID=3133429 RepID=UPI0030C37DCA
MADVSPRVAHAKLPAATIGKMISRALHDALESGCIGRMNSVHEIMERERTQGFEGLCSMVLQDTADFLLVAAPGFDRQLKLASGRGRDEWLNLMS